MAGSPIRYIRYAKRSVVDSSSGCKPDLRLEALVAQAAERGLGPAKRETYPNGVRKITYRDEDGTEVGFGGVRG